MQVSDMMTRSVTTLPPSATLKEAARIMRDSHIGFIPVQEADGRLVGAVTDRDICCRGVADGQPSISSEIRSVMSEGCVCCHADEDGADVARRMAENQVRRLPVLDREGRLVGVVSLGDLAHRAEAEHQVGRAMSGISAPSGGPRFVEP